MNDGYVSAYVERYRRSGWFTSHPDNTKGTTAAVMHAERLAAIAAEFDTLLEDVAQAQAAAS